MIVNRAGRAALGIAFCLAVLALAFTYAGYRLTTWPIRKLAERDPRTAKRQAAIGLVAALGVLVAALRESGGGESP